MSKLFPLAKILQPLVDRQRHAYLGYNSVLQPQQSGHIIHLLDKKHHCVALFVVLILLTTAFYLKNCIFNKMSLSKKTVIPAL